MVATEKPGADQREREQKCSTAQTVSHGAILLIARVFGLVLTTGRRKSATRPPDITHSEKCEARWAGRNPGCTSLNGPGAAWGAVSQATASSATSSHVLPTGGFSHPSTRSRCSAFQLLLVVGLTLSASLRLDVHRRSREPRSMSRPKRGRDLLYRNASPDRRRARALRRDRGGLRGGAVKARAVPQIASSPGWSRAWPTRFPESRAPKSPRGPTFGPSTRACREGRPGPGCPGSLVG